MQEHLQRSLSEFDDIPKRLLPSVSSYLLFLMVTMKRHEAAQAAELFGVNASRYSRLLNKEDALTIAKNCLNRAARRRLTALDKLIKRGHRPYVICDATFIGRRGQVENSGHYRSGTATVNGHRVTNLILLINDEIIPLSAIPHYTREYCLAHDLTYKTESAIVVQWLSWLHASGLFTRDQIKYLHFIFDSGYDIKDIQCAVRRIGAHFTMSVKSNRAIAGIPIKEYFRRHRKIPWKTIRLQCGSGGKGSRRVYRTRHAARVKLKGFGLVTAVCSEKKRYGRRTSRKFLVSSNHRLSVREIVAIYRKRWTIEMWHREMKQNHGYRDSQSRRFRAVEAHINYCLAAYCLQGEKGTPLPRKGTTAAELKAALEIKEMARVITLFGGRRKLQETAAAAIERVANA